MQRAAVQRESEGYSSARLVYSLIDLIICIEPILGQYYDVIRPGNYTDRVMTSELHRVDLQSSADAF